MTFDEVRALALAWPGVEDSTSYRTPALKMRGKLLARLREDGETLVLPGVEHDERDMLMEVEPAVFFVTPHYLDWPSVLVRLPAADLTHVEPLLRRRWDAIGQAKTRVRGTRKVAARDKAGLTTQPSSKAFAIKAEVRDPQAASFAFHAHKTMYEGKRITKGDTIFVFASENEGGEGLIARGTVETAEPVAKTEGIDRQTPRVSVTIRRTAVAKRQLGRADLKPFKSWQDGDARTELNFKFYRQATNKIVGISTVATAFLDGFFEVDAQTYES